MAHSELFERQTALVQLNLSWLRQAQDMLAAIDDKTYRKAPRALGAQRVAGHLRHVIEFYECFLDGLDLSHIDYDARRRDVELEASREVAAARIELLIERMGLDPALRGDGVIFVRMEDATGLGVPEPYLMSSIGRELQALSSHTIHHLALIALVLGAHGHRVDPKFGLAPSTLRYREEARGHHQDARVAA
jgi:hypothetical protein